MQFLSPITLKGQFATIEPLHPEHHDALIAAVSDGKLWKLWYTAIPKPETCAPRSNAACTCSSRAACCPS